MILCIQIRKLLRMSNRVLFLQHKKLRKTLRIYFQLETMQHKLLRMGMLWNRQKQLPQCFGIRIRKQFRMQPFGKMIRM
jgi:hypothetical protein